MACIRDKNILTVDEKEQLLPSIDKTVNSKLTTEFIVNAPWASGNAHSGTFDERKLTKPKVKILMKIPNRLELYGFVTQTCRLKQGASLGLGGQVAVSERHVPSVGSHSKGKNSDEIRLRIQNFFYHAPMAKNVQLVGDFTDWLKMPINLRKGSEGTWWKAVRLEVGTHYYRFFVDGEWRDDPECSFFASNSFGSQNAIRQVF